MQNQNNEQENKVPMEGKVVQQQQRQRKDGTGIINQEGESLLTGI